MSEERESELFKLRFSGRKEDWPIWSTQFLALAQLKKFKRSLLGQELPPNEDEDLDEDSSDAETRKKSKARTANEKAYSALTLTCSEPKAFRIIYNAKTKELPSGSASLAWTRLKARFEPQTGATLTQLKREFTQSKLEKGESPDEWIERLESIRNTIEQILGKPHIDDTDMMLHIINNLPDEYEVIIDRVTKELSNKTLTLESLQEDLQEKFERMKTKKSGSQETALYSKQVKTRCHGCGKIGHRKEDCWELESNKEKRPKNWRSNEKNESGNKHNKNPNIVCWKCNKKGHIQANCPENKEQESGMMASQEEEASEIEVSFMAMSGTEKKSDLWIGDTGASTHMTNTLDGLFNLQNEETTVKIGNGERLTSSIVGTLKATVEQVDGSKIEVILKNVAYVPELTRNLFSITKALENGFKLSNKGNIMILSKGTKMVKFDRLQRTKNGFCPGIQMRIKVDHEKANFASGTHDSGGHQKFENSGQKLSKITPKGPSGIDSLKLEDCEFCYMGIVEIKRKNVDISNERNASVVKNVEKFKIEEAKFKIEEKIESQEEEFEIERKSEKEEKIEKEKIENDGEKMNERKDKKIVPREKKKEKIKKENQIWDINQGTGREKFVVEKNLEENCNQETEKENLKENSDQKYGRKKFEEISKKSEKFEMLQRFMKYSRTDVVGIDHEKVINGEMKMVRKYFRKIAKHENESNKKKLRYSFKRGKMKINARRTRDGQRETDTIRTI